MTKRITLLIPLLILTIISFGQQKKDTLINKRYYNFIDYYPNGNLKILGCYQDSLKTGNWIYYKMNGSKKAYGQYKKGKKNGKWVYYNSNHKKIKLIWSGNNPPEESFGYGEDGDILIFDSIYIRPCTTIYLNGFPTKSIRWM